MKVGEKRILLGMVALVVVSFLYQSFVVVTTDEKDPGIPFYSTASKVQSNAALLLIKREGCRDCHALWTIRNIMQSVPAPALDGIGSLREQAWLYDYLSSDRPQSILPSRLKAEYQMPSYSHLSEDERQLLAHYLASLKVEEWYLFETKKRAYEKLTGKEYLP